MRIVDVWMQHPRVACWNSPSLSRSAAGHVRTLFLDIPDIPLSMTIGTMDQAGIEVGLAAAWCGPQGVLIGNDEVASFVRQYPRRLLGVASVNLARPMEAVRELRRCVRELGFGALRIVPWVWGLPPDDRRYYPLYAECIELDVPFCLQVGHTGPLMSSEPGRPIPILRTSPSSFPSFASLPGTSVRPGHRRSSPSRLSFPTSTSTRLPTRQRASPWILSSSCGGGCQEGHVRQQLSDAHGIGLPRRRGGSWAQ